MGTTASTSSSKNQPLASLGGSDGDKQNSELSGDSNSSIFQEKDGYYIWEKGEVYKLSDHFSTKELDCHCKYKNCKEQRISKDLIDRLEKVRTEVGQPLIITSAYRCTPYQEYLRNTGVNTVVAKKSTHELGDAVDAFPKRGTIADFETICEKHFDSIGVANTFLHLDIRKGYRRWKY